MSYSSNPARLVELSQYLAPLVERKAVRWLLTADGSTKQTPAEVWAYKVRQALFIAGQNSGTFPDLAYAYHHCVVEILDATTVQARFPDEPIELEALAAEPALASEIINMWESTHELVQDKLYLPLTSLNRAEANTLCAWADMHEPRLMILLSASGALTVAPYDEEIAPYAAKPTVAEWEWTRGIPKRREES